MPLAVKRIPGPIFPLDVALSNADALMPGVELSALAEIEVSATLSQTGSVNPTSGDVRAAARVTTADAAGAVELVLNDVVP